MSDRNTILSNQLDDQQQQLDQLSVSIPSFEALLQGNKLVAITYIDIERCL